MSGEDDQQEGGFAAAKATPKDDELATAEVQQNLAPLWIRVIRGLPVDATALRHRTFEFFDSHSNADAYFSLLAHFSISDAIRSVSTRPLTLEYGVREALDWEDLHPDQRLHKGTAYYFLGMREILLGDLDLGFRWMHQALVEDQLSTGTDAPDGPALAFATMDGAKLEQAFRDEVVRYAMWVEERLEQYRGSGRGDLTIDGLRQRAIDRAGLLEPLFTTTFIVARMLRLESLNAAIARDNPFAHLLASSLLADLTLVIDSAVQAWRPGLWRPLQQAREGAGAMGIVVTQTELEEVNRRQQIDFAATVTDLLGGQYVTADGRTPEDREIDALLTYTVRNHTAHGAAGEKLLGEELEVLEKRLFFQLFAVWEHLLA